MTDARRVIANWAAPAPRRMRAIRDRLREIYGIPREQPHGHPIAELILTVLSQSTNDRNRDVAYLALRERFPEWSETRDAPVDEIEAAIRPGGISKVKSARIKVILRAITDNPRPGSDVPPGELSLDWLRELSVPAAQDYLCSLPGVGRKTAACVLLFALGMRDVPVDTHVSRVGTRLGLFPPPRPARHPASPTTGPRRSRPVGAPFEELHDTLLELTPPGQELEFHMNLLRHGRRTCHARRPECGACALARMCPSAGTFG